MRHPERQRGLTIFFSFGLNVALAELASGILILFIHSGLVHLEVQSEMEGNFRPPEAGAAAPHAMDMQHASAASLIIIAMEISRSLPFVCCEKDLIKSVQNCGVVPWLQHRKSLL